MVLHPQYSPTIPLTTREPKIPVSSPLTNIPIFCDFFSGWENCAAMGIKICGITEQIPVIKDTAKVKYM